MMLHFPVQIQLQKKRCHNPRMGREKARLQVLQVKIMELTTKVDAETQE